MLERMDYEGIKSFCATSMEFRQLCEQINRRIPPSNMDRYFILGLIIAMLLFVYLRSYANGNPFRVLVIVVCTDRDVDLAPKLYEAIKTNTATSPIVIVTREGDTQTRVFWRDKALVITIPDYEILKRHNIPKIAEKRTIALKYAKENGFDAVWFVDSDIIPTKGVLSQLSITNKDVCLAPYRVPWSGEACVGIADSQPPFVKIHFIDLEDLSIKRRPCIVGGLGCTLVKSSAFEQVIEYYRLNREGFYVEGEDIGFFMNCYKSGLTCEYLTRWEQPHYYDRVSRCSS